MPLAVQRVGPVCAGGGGGARAEGLGPACGGAVSNPPSPRCARGSEVLLGRGRALASARDHGLCLRPRGPPCHRLRSGAWAVRAEGRGGGGGGNAQATGHACQACAEGAADALPVLCSEQGCP